MTLKLIIVGASITGLSLANMIEELSLDIEFVVLEAYPRIAPQVGASIGLLPNGLRILDQLGCYERIRSIAGNFYLKTVMRNSQGHLLTESRGASVSERLEERTGYPSLFIDRQMLLQVLYDNLKQKSRVIPGKRVIRADLDSDRACVHTEDGSTYEGDLVVGADGVHSIIRREMWRIASEVESNPFLPDEGSRLKSKTCCIFGISKTPDRYPSATQHAVFYDGWSYLTVSGPGDRLYWFLFCDMPRMAYGKDIPRWSKEDETELAEQHASNRITDGVTFADIYNNRQVSTLVSLEEHVFSRWHFGRFITIGDSAHKVHPITAQGGNGAMESAAALVNALSSRLQNTQNLSPDDIEAVFSEVQSRRFRRAEDIVKEGEMIQSIVNQQYTFSALMIKYLVPVFGDRLFFDGWLKNSVGGLRVEGLPFPQRSKNKAFKDELMTKNSDGRYWKLWSITIGLGSLLASWFLLHGGKMPTTFMKLG